MIIPISVYIDSDAFIALIKSDDSNHAKAVETLTKFDQSSVLLYTSTYVFSETVTVLSQRLGRKYAEEFINMIKDQSAAITFLWSDEQIQEEAIKVFLKQKSKNVSFVDCINIALIKERYIDVVFSFDKIYKKNGIKYA